ncbi:hypothetical protein AKO1_007531 [Acrasis kona]|uniref:CAP-Gly domain-containing protein n=1 Tax=Acrasis kona TaxID=1008807 RepID=A0AAW2Z6A3_9EUKA
MEDIKVGNRFIYDGADKGIIKYIGKLEGSKEPDAVWVGVEWENNGRGKNDGEAFGKRYFQTNPNSASFIKHGVFTKNANVEVSFLSAMVDKYKQEGDSEMSFSKNITATLVGREKVEKLLSQIDKLRKVGLQGKGITHVESEVANYTPRESSIFHFFTFKVIEDVDLAGNMLDHFPMEFTKLRLKTLLLSHNPIKTPPSGLFEHLKVLVLNGIPWTIQTLGQALQFTPVLEELHFRDNQVVDLGDIKWGNLKTLYLAGNKLSQWSEIEKLGSIPTLEWLVLTKNHLTSVQYKPGSFQNLRALSIGDNQINSYETVNELNNFPNLNEVRMDNNPISNLHGLIDTRQFVIGRIKKLSILNGSEVKNKERIDSEKYYLRFIGNERFKLLEKNKKDQDFMNFNPRYQELSAKYGDPLELLMEFKERSRETVVKKARADTVSLIIKNRDQQ